MIEKQSPYLSHQDRLSDVIAAIQVMGVYRYSARKIDAWIELLGSTPKSADSWLTIFNEHPEFFRAGLDEDGLHTLVLRRAQPRTFNTKTGDEITVKEFKVLDESARKQYSRRPLSTDQILALIDAAAKLQTQAAVRRQELRWWVSIVVTALAALAGSIIGATWSA